MDGGGRSNLQPPFVRDYPPARDNLPPPLTVMDAEDKGAYSYELATGTRLKHKEFMTVPDNDNPSGGMTGHELRFWVVDSDDEMLYAYGRLNASPTFSETSANFKIHRTAAAGDYVGSVPEVSDPDGDTITYLLTSGGLGVFRMDPQTGEIFLRGDASGFTGGEEYTLEVAVTDNKSKLGGLSSDADDAINVTITVTQNADPQITTADGTVFSVAEDATEDDTIAQLSITDLDGDPLFYASQITPNNPFSQSQGMFKLSNGRTLDYESTNYYTINIQIRDNKDESGQADFSWDDEIDFTIQVTNVNEDGEIILDSAHPEVATEIVATLTDPDGVDFSNGNQVNWVLEKSTDETNWIEISDTDTGSSTHAYTPVTTDRGTYLRFKATYSDGYDTVNAKTTQIQSANKVAAEAPSNSSPRFTEGSSSTRFIAEDAGGGSNVGSPVSATDPDEDTLAYLFVSYSVGQFHGDSETGQILLAEDATLDYEDKQTYYVRVVVLDNLDPLGNADDSFDGTNLVTISVTNVEEAGSVQLSSDSPEVDDEVTAELSDPDGSIANLVWVWQTADSSGSTTWTDINGATSDSYTPTVGDIGKYLRARATYDDGEGTGKEATATASGAVVRLDNAPPTFDEGASATRSINENPEAGTRVGAVVTATDPDGDALTYSLASGADSEKFSIDSSSGRLEVAAGAALDFETDAEFEVELQVSDGKATDHSQDNTVDAAINLTINLLNLDEPGTVALSSTDPEVGTSITATLNDPDGVDSNDWHWEKSQDGETGWTTIPDASAEDYTPASGDVGMYLRAMAEYTDGEGSGKSANTMTDDSVKSPPVDTSLASLTLGRIPFTFSSNTLEYNLTVPNGKKKTKVIATPTAGSGVSVEITPADLNPNKPGNLVGLEEGENQIIITVSEDQGSASTTYTVLVTREAAETQDPPQQDPPQQDPPSGGRLAEDCENQEDAGLIAYCGTYPFAVVRVEFDGSYTIEWSEWDSDHLDVTGYSVLLSQFLYRMYEDENGSNIDYNRLSQIYESCEFRSGEWDCQGALPPMNGWVDWEGNPTENLEFTTNEDLTEWSYAMEEPGRHPAEETY